MSAYSNLMSVRNLFAILAAIAVLFAPALTNAGMAYAAGQDHQEQMMEEGHCDPASDQDQDKPASMDCCGAMCMAVATPPPAAAPFAEPLLGNLPFAALQTFESGIPEELATPPPRAA